MEELDISSFCQTITGLYHEMKKEHNGRDRSWEHCYLVFHEANVTGRIDADYLSLQLAFYLASWGDVSWVIVSSSQGFGNCQGSCQ